MGSSLWSDEHFSARKLDRAATGKATFAHTDDIKHGRVDAKVHVALDPSKMKAGLRECRDSDKHPQSNPVFVGFDVTGSMHQVPEIIQKNLCSLMGLLLRKSYLTDPAICVAGIGDATYDRAPLQIGQFESGIEIENDLTNLFLEGGGGDQQTESYELALYFLAHKTSCDAWNKRQRKGYAFIIGDEMAYPVAKRREVNAIFGDKLQADIPIEQLVADVRERWELFYVLPNLTSYYNDAKIFGFWKDLLVQNAVKLDDPNGISELIATTIGLCEGAVDMDGIRRDLTDSGSGGVADNVTKALATVGASRTGLTELKGSGLVTL